MTRNSLILALIAVVSSAGFAVPARGANAGANPGRTTGQAIRLAVAAQPIAAALNDFARQSGLHVVIGSEVARGITSAPIEGIYTPEAALAGILADTGLRYEYLDARTVAVMGKKLPSAERAGQLRSLRLAQAGVSAADQEQGLSQSDGDATTARNSGERVEEVVVTGKVNIVENDAFGATKMGMSLKDTPSTVLSINSDLIDIASVRSIGDLGKLDAAGSGNGRDGASDVFYTRGYAVTERIDGFRSTFSGLLVNNDLAAYERVEIVKGGVSTVYGQSEPGGVVNYVTKLPEQESAARFKAEAGSDNYQRLEGDLTGSLFGSDKWTYRVIASGQNDDTFRDHSRDDRVMVTPSVMYRGESASLILRSIYQTQDVSYSTNDAGALQLDAPLPAGMTWQNAVANRVVGLQFADIPRSRWLAPIGAGAKSEIFLVQAQHDYVLPSQWKIRSNIQYSTNRVERTTVTVTAPYDVNGNTLGFERELNSLDRADMLSAEMNIFGGFHLLGREHTLFFGVDYATWTPTFAQLATPDRNAGASAALNLFNPNYDAARSLVTLDEAQLTAFTGTRSDLTYFGITGQVVFKPMDRLSILLGGRFSSDSSGSASDTTRQSRQAASRAAGDLETSASRAVFENFSKQGGITYALTEQLNIYASAGETFVPSASRTYVEGSLTGKAIDPQMTETYELGLKGQFARSLGFSFALFDVTQDAVVPDLLHPTFSVLAPGWRSRGAEASLQGRFFDSLNIFGSVAYQDAEYSENPLRGMTSAMAPKFGFTLFSTYEILTGSLRGLGVGAGILHKSGRDVRPQEILSYADGEAFTIDFGDFTSVDARVFYNRERWGIYGAATNLTDEKHFTDVGSPIIIANNRVNPGRQLRVGATFKF